MDKKKVLVVDDSAIIAKQLKKILEGQGDFEVVGQARNGVEGLKLFSTLKPDIVLMDIVMPELDGIQAIRSIMSLDENAKIVVVSSTGGVGDQVAEALNFGARNVITKPFVADRVINVLKGV
jgi:two-component system chemotaxis response regulator CheY